jgi:hypothetical protein
MTEMAASLGCVFELCCDDDAVDGVPRYSWLVRVPRDEHLRRNDQGTADLPEPAAMQDRLNERFDADGMLIVDPDFCIDGQTATSAGRLLAAALTRPAHDA